MIAMKDPLKIVGNNFISPFSEEMGRRISERYLTEYSSVLHGDLFHVITWLSDIFLGLEKVHFSLENRYILGGKININLSNIAVWQEKTSIMLSDISLGWRELHTNIQKNSNEQRYIFFWVKNRMFQQGNLPAVSVLSNIKKWQGETYTTVPDISPQQKEVHLYLKSNVVQEEKFLNLSRSALCQEKTSIMLSDISLGRKELHINASISRENNTKMQGNIYHCARHLPAAERSTSLFEKQCGEGGKVFKFVKECPLSGEKKCYVVRCIPGAERTAHKRNHEQRK